MAIKGVLREELENSIKLKKRYEQELAKLPKGSLIKKVIRGHKYYYVVYRERGKVKFAYEGRYVSDNKKMKYNDAKRLRARYRNLLSRVKKQIRFLKGALRGKEAI